MNVVCSLDMFLHLNLCLRTVCLAFKKYIIVIEVFPSLKMEWLEEEQRALINILGGSQFYGSPKIEIITKGIINWMCGWKSEKILLSLYVLSMSASTWFGMLAQN